MLENILVGVIVLIAAIYVGRRFYRQFFSKSPSCGCSGCGQSSNCSGIQDSPDPSRCDGNR